MLWPKIRPLHHLNKNLPLPVKPRRLRNKVLHLLSKHYMRSYLRINLIDWLPRLLSILTQLMLRFWPLQPSLRRLWMPRPG